MGLKISKQKL